MAWPTGRATLRERGASHADMLLKLRIASRVETRRLFARPAEKLTKTHPFLAKRAMYWRSGPRI